MINYKMSDTENTPEPEPTPEPESENYGSSSHDEPVLQKKKKNPMTDTQKKQLTKHMDKVGKNWTTTERKSHRMKMMGKMRRGETIGKAHKSVMASDAEKAKRKK